MDPIRLLIPPTHSVNILRKSSLVDLLVLENIVTWIGNLLYNCLFLYIYWILIALDIFLKTVRIKGLKVIFKILEY